MFYLKNLKINFWLFLAFCLSPFFWINLFSIFYYNNKCYQKKITRKKKVIITRNYILLSDGYKLVANYHFFPNSKPLFVFVHGLGSHLHETKWLEAIFLQKQYSYLNYSRRHSGINADSDFKNYSLNFEIYDCQEILITLRNLYPHKKIIVIGHSLGAILLLKIATLPEIQDLDFTFALINSPTQLAFFTNKTFLPKIVYHFFITNFSYKFLNFSRYVMPNFFPVLVNCSKYCDNQKYNNFFKFCQQKKVNFSAVTNYMKVNNFTFRKLPLYYFTYIISLSEDGFKNIHHNQKNKIIFFQSKNDLFFDAKIMQKYQINWKANKNIRIVNLEIMSHRFFFDETANKKYFLKYILSQLDDNNFAK